MDSDDDSSYEDASMWELTFQFMNKLDPYR